MLDRLFILYKEFLLISSSWLFFEPLISPQLLSNTGILGGYKTRSSLSCRSFLFEMGKSVSHRNICLHDKLCNRNSFSGGTCWGVQVT